MAAELSVVIITKNEADNISAALESVSWADDIVVVDSHSSDDTTTIARRYTDRVYTRTWQGYGAQKNYASGLAVNDWILSLDADERVTPELAAEIQAALRRSPALRGYRIPRTTRYLGRWIRSTDWYPDYQLRLYDRRVAAWNERIVHESVTVQGKIGTLSSELHHYAYDDLADHLATINHYTTLAAQQFEAEQRTVGAADLVVHPPLVFLRNYVLRGGYRDGAAGLIISLMNTYYVFLKFAKRWEQQRAARNR